MAPRQGRRSLGATAGAAPLGQMPPAPPRRAARPVPDLPGTAAPDSGPPDSVPPDSGARTSGTPEVAKYLRLERKESLIWPHQAEALTLLRRVLNRRRPKGEGERITENTLIRVAIDLLLSRKDELDGVSEDELRRSLGI